MITALGWLLLLGGVAAGIWVLRARAAAAAAAGRTGAPAAPTNAQYTGVIAALVVGIWLIATGAGATARLAETNSWDFSKDPQWLINNSGAVQWDQAGGRLKFNLTPGSDAYAVAPVDWNADAFRAEFDITLDQVTTSPKGAGVVGVGLFDGSISNIEDTDHVGGSTIQASFGDPRDGNELWLRASDTNLLTRSDPPKGERPKQPIQLQPGKTYHAVLAYNRRDNTATLEVSEPGGGQPLARLKVEELKDFTPSVAYFGISVKGYKKGKDDKPAPVAVGTLDNVRFFQP